MDQGFLAEFFASGIPLGLLGLDFAMNPVVAKPIETANNASSTQEKITQPTLTRRQRAARAAIVECVNTEGEERNKNQKLEKRDFKRLVEQETQGLERAIKDEKSRLQKERKIATQAANEERLLKEQQKKNNAALLETVFATSGVLNVIAQHRQPAICASVLQAALLGIVDHTESRIRTLAEFLKVGADPRKVDKNIDKALDKLGIKEISAIDYAGILIERVRSTIGSDPNAEQKLAHLSEALEFLNKWVEMYDARMAAPAAAEPMPAGGLASRVTQKRQAGGHRR